MTPRRFSAAYGQRRFRTPGRTSAESSSPTFRGIADKAGLDEMHIAVFDAIVRIRHLHREAYFALPAQRIGYFKLPGDVLIRTEKLIGRIVLRPIGGSNVCPNPDRFS